MKPQVGTISKFNGYGGNIKSNDQDYLLLDSNIIEKKEPLQVNDEVEFIPEIEKEVPIARFVKKRKKQDN